MIVKPVPPVKQPGELMRPVGLAIMTGVLRLSGTSTPTMTVMQTRQPCWNVCRRRWPSSFSIVLTFFTVKRVHWLRARALNQRWHEEEILVEYEMQWTVRYFLYKCKEWEEGRDKADASAGARAYAIRQARRWRQFAEAANSLFSRATAHYLSPLHNY